MNDELFPRIKRSIENYLAEEEGNISRSKLLKIGSMVLLMGILFMQDAFAGHRSHSSHKSHSSHSSHSSGSSGHSSHVSHVSHSSHSSGSGGTPSHSSHSSGSFVTSPPQTTPAIVATPEPLPSVPTPHTPPLNNFATDTTFPQQPNLSIPDTPTIAAAMIPLEKIN